MYASGGFMLCGPSHSLPARQQLKEPRLREKDLHLNIAINDFCSEAVMPRLWLTSWHSRSHRTSPILRLPPELD